MKTIPKKTQFWLLCLLLASCLCANAQTATPPTTYARVFYLKVEAANVKEYLKLVGDNIRPGFQQAKKSGDISDWILYSSTYAGGNSEYNLISVFIYDSWAKTERAPNVEDVIKKANPNLDAAGIAAKLGSMRKIVKQEFYRQLDAVPALPNVHQKYILVNYMQPKPGMGNDYQKDEKEVWKPVHQEFVKSGQLVAWSFWQLIMPSGSLQPFSYVTVDDYADFSKLNAVKFEETVKKVYPSKTMESIFTQTSNLRDATRTELWEAVDGTN